MIDRRAFLGAAACGVMGLGLSGCSQVEGGDAGSSDDVPPSWVTCRIGKPSAIDPLLVSDRFGLQVLHALFCPLTRIVDGVATPAAARSITASDDARTFTFSLVEGATFHNGESVTASCFKRAWERLVKPMSDDTDEDGHTRRMVARALVAAGDPCFPPSMGMMPCLAAGPRNWSVCAVLTTSRLPCRLPSRMQPSPRLSRIQLSVLFPRVRRTIPLCFRNSPWAMDRSC